MTNKPEDSLCANHKLFIAEYIKNGRNGTKAYQHVYGKEMADDDAAANASRLLRNDKVKAVLDKRLEDVAAIACIDAAWALKMRMEIVQRSMLAEKVLDHKGKPTGEYKYDAPGANAALNAIEKVHLGMAERQELDTNFTVVVKNYSTKVPDGK